MQTENSRCETHKQEYEYIYLDKDNIKPQYYCKQCQNTSEKNDPEKNTKIVKIKELKKLAKSFHKGQKDLYESLDQPLKKIKMQQQDIFKKHEDLKLKQEGFYKLEKEIRDVEFYKDYSKYTQLMQNPFLFQLNSNYEEEKRTIYYLYQEWLKQCYNSIQEIKKQIQQSLQANSQVKIQEHQIQHQLQLQVNQQSHFKIEPQQQQNNKVKCNDMNIQFQHSLALQPCQINIQLLLKAQEKEQNKQINEEKLKKSPQKRFYRNVFKFHVFNQDIKKILEIDANQQLVASNLQLILCKNCKVSPPIYIPKPILSIHYFKSNEIKDIQIILRTEDILYFLDNQLQTKREIPLGSKGNDFAYDNGFIYHYESSIQKLRKYQLENQFQLKPIQQIEIQNGSYCVEMKVVENQLYIGLSNGQIQIYDTQTLRLKGKQEFKGNNFHKFYFEKDYCLAIQTSYLSMKVYNEEKIKQNLITAKANIIECAYLIDIQKKDLEIQCLQANGKIYTLKKKDDLILRQDCTKYKDVSSLFASQQNQRFYIGFKNGDLQCDKLRVTTNET